MIEEFNIESEIAALEREVESDIAVVELEQNKLLEGDISEMTMNEVSKDGLRQSGGVSPGIRDLGNDEGKGRGRLKVQNESPDSALENLESAGKVHENNQKDTNQVRRSTSDVENEKMDTYGQQVQQQRI